jgi:hypothetical protein
MAVDFSSVQKFIDGSISNNFSIFLPLAFILKSHDGLFYLGTQISMAGHLWLQTINVNKRATTLIFYEGQWEKNREIIGY